MAEMFRSRVRGSGANPYAFCMFIPYVAVAPIQYINTVYLKCFPLSSPAVFKTLFVPKKTHISEWNADRDTIVYLCVYLCVFPAHRITSVHRIGPGSTRINCSLKMNATYDCPVQTLTARNMALNTWWAADWLTLCSPRRSGNIMNAALCALLRHGCMS